MKPKLNINQIKTIVKNMECLKYHFEVLEHLAMNIVSSKGEEQEKLIQEFIEDFLLMTISLQAELLEEFE